jgi:hypothetical protein
MSDPERGLWRAVLAQAFEDAELTPIGDECVPEPIESSMAREYLRADDLNEAAHLRLVCGFAEIPVDRVISWARRRYPRAA